MKRMRMDIARSSGGLRRISDESRPIAVCGTNDETLLESNHYIVLRTCMGMGLPTLCPPSRKYF